MIRTQMFPVLLAVSAAAMPVGGCSIDHSRCATGPAIRDASVQEMAELYELAVAPRPYAVRVPTRLQSQRAMHLLAEKAAEVAAEIGSQAHPVSLTGADRSDAPGRIESFRQALLGLEAAARKADVHAVHDRFADVMAAHRGLCGSEGSMN